MLYVGHVKGGVEFAAKFPYPVGIVTFMVFPEFLRTDEGFADKVKVLVEDPFFDLLEIGPIGDHEWSKFMNVIKASGRDVKVAVGLQPEVLVRKFNPNALNEEERRKAEEVLVKDTEIAGKRGVKAVALCSGPNVEGPEREKAREALIKTLSAMAAKAAEYGANVYVETFDYSWDKKRLLGPIGFSAKVIEDVRALGHKNVWLMWDLSHAPMLGEKPEDLKPYADLLGHIHVGCTKRVEDKLLDWHPGFYRPGAINTEKELAELLKVLHDIKYSGAVSFEVKPEEGQHPMEVVNTAKAVLIRAYQLFLDGI